ncbi:unnamed protein product [Arabidopsis thaliana]|uniref:(thale cress) hypothetical protein n=1 Tax=Arabidopsis thaliana TaxID=3702 RepID=A0A7G2E8C8_ARATH|nr:unnamed protein product [Arabidopsis thaliana]
MADESLTKADLQGFTEVVTSALTAMTNQMALTTELKNVNNNNNQQNGREEEQIDPNENQRRGRERDPIMVTKISIETGEKKSQEWITVLLSMKIQVLLKRNLWRKKLRKGINKIVMITVFFEVMGIPEKKQVKMVAIRLKSIAAVWWDTLVVQRQRQRNGAVRTWRRDRKSESSKVHQWIKEKMGLQTVWIVQEASSLALKPELMEKSACNFTPFRRYSPQNNSEVTEDKEKTVLTRDANIVTNNVTSKAIFLRMGKQRLSILCITVL